MKRNPDELREMVLRHIERNKLSSSHPNHLINLTQWWWKKQFKSAINSPEYALAQLLLSNSVNGSLVVVTWLPKLPNEFIESAELKLYTNGFFLFAVHSGKPWSALSPSTTESEIAALAHSHTGPPLFPFLTDLIGEAMVQHVNASAVSADRILEQQRAEEKARQTAVA